MVGFVVVGFVVDGFVVAPASWLGNTELNSSAFARSVQTPVTTPSFMRTMTGVRKTYSGLFPVSPARTWNNLRSSQPLQGMPSGVPRASGTLTFITRSLRGSAK